VLRRRAPDHRPAWGPGPPVRLPAQFTTQGSPLSLSTKKKKKLGYLVNGPSSAPNTFLKTQQHLMTSVSVTRDVRGLIVEEYGPVLLVISQHDGVETTSGAKRSSQLIKRLFLAKAIQRLMTMNKKTVKLGSQKLLILSHFFKTYLNIVFQLMSISPK
jgi:hypothetical protein